ncbi:MAG: type II secretion system protein GspN [Polyangiaceae bacterium]
MRERLLKIAKIAVYPFFYLFCLALFGYLSFPYDALKNRIIAEFDKSQEKAARRSRSSGGPMRLELDELDSYWVSGVEVTGARLIIPPKPDLPTSKKKSPLSFGKAKAADDEPDKPSVLTIDRATARVRLLPLLIGDVTIDFAAEAFGGEVSGHAPYGKGGGDVAVEFDGLSLGEIEPLGQLLQGIPMSGLASGALALTPMEGKFSKAEGHLNATIAAVKLGGKRKNEDGEVEDVLEVQGVALPSVQLGNLVIEATAADGTLTLDDFGTKGRDFELYGEGKIKLNETWDRSQADIYIRFKFTDAYRSKSDAASSLLGKPGDSFDPAIEIAPGSPFKRAKTDDGFYRFHISGPLNKLKFDPAGEKTSAAPKGRKTTPSTPRLPSVDKSSPTPPVPRVRLPRPRPEPREEEPREEPPAPPEPEPAREEPPAPAEHGDDGSEASPDGADAAHPGGDAANPGEGDAPEE